MQSCTYLLTLQLHNCRRRYSQTGRRQKRFAGVIAGALSKGGRTSKKSATSTAADAATRHAEKIGCLESAHCNNCVINVKINGFAWERSDKGEGMKPLLMFLVYCAANLQKAVRRQSSRAHAHHQSYTIDRIVRNYESRSFSLVTSLKEGPVCPCVLRINFDTRSDTYYPRSTAPSARLLLDLERIIAYFMILLCQTVKFCSKMQGDCP
jgi:hypothetical protein